MRALLLRIRRILKDRRTRRLFTRLVSSVAAIVVFVTTYALVLPAITLEKNAACGFPEHQHTDSCYEEVLVCDVPESEGHAHDDSCYTVKQILDCETPEHQHDETCYDEEGNVNCEQKEHKHTEECYKEEKELTCGLEESEGHVHGASCYEKVLTCGMEPHTHSAACYLDDSASTSGTSEAPVAAATGNTAATAASTAAAAGSAGTGTGTAIEFESDDNPADTTGSQTGTAAGSATASESESATFSTGHDTYGNENAGTGETESSAGALTASDSALAGADQYIPTLDALDFDTLLNKQTGIYYYSAAEDEVVEDSSAIAAEDWHKVEEDTELGENDLLRVYLAYTVPAGALNSTNPIARYRLPGNLHLTDAQVKAINETVNGIAAQYENLDTLEILDTEKYHAYLGAEAVEGGRCPSDDLDEYLRDLVRSGEEGAEYISATVQVENVYDEEGLYGDKDAYLGQDLIFTFSPYTIEKNQNEYDRSGKPTKAGEKIKGWFTLDFNMSQVDLEDETSSVEASEKISDETSVEASEKISDETSDETSEEISVETSDDDSADSTESNRSADTGAVEIRTADIIFVSEDRDLGIKEISTLLKVVKEAEVDQDTDSEQNTDAEQDEKDGQNEKPDQDEEAAVLNADSAQNGGTGQNAEVDQDAESEQNAEAADQNSDTAFSDTALKEDNAEADQGSETDLNEDNAEAAGTAATETATAEESVKAGEAKYTSGTLNAEGDGYKITLDYTAEAQIPEEASLKVREITAQTDKEAYEACLEQAKAQVACNADDKTSVDKAATRFFDIEIVAPASEDKDHEDSDHEADNGHETDNDYAVDSEHEANNGHETDNDYAVDSEHGADNGHETDNSDETVEMQKIEPKAPVSVNIQLTSVPTPVIKAAEENQTQADPTVLHFADHGVEAIDSTVNKTANETVNETDTETHFSGNEDSNEDNKETRPATEIKFETESFSIYGVVYTSAITKRYLSADGTTYDITVLYEEEAQIPEDADLNVREITPDTTEYQDYLRQSADHLDAESIRDISYARFFDIEIVDEDGQKIEPAAPVLVHIEYADGAQIEAAKDLHVVHFADDGTEVLEGIGVNQDGTVMTYLQDGFSVTGTVVTNPAANDQYMVLIDYKGSYYIVNNDGSLTNVGPSSSNTVNVDEPMMWTYDGRNIYHHSEQVSFNSGQLAADFYNKYIDPTDTADGISKDQDNPGTTLRNINEQYFDWNTYRMQTFTYQVVQNRPQQNQTRITLAGDKLKSANSEQYLGIVEDADGTPHLVGGVSAGKAVTVKLAQANQVLKTNYLNHTVNHIDISIEGDANVDVPLAYGVYYDANGNPIKEVTSPESLTLNSGVVGITMDDMKRAIITAYTKDADGKVTEIDNAFVVTGYSANESTAFSTQQVRIEGEFRTSTIAPVSQWYYNSNKERVWQDRLNNRIYYKVTAYKTLTFNLVDPEVGQLYDSDGKPLSVKVDVAFSASFDYWDQRNECPPVRWDQDWLSGKGTIPDHNLSGMDFVLGGNGEGSAKSRAVEIIKIIQDENGSPIEIKAPIQHSFELYRYDDVKNSNSHGTRDHLRNQDYIWGRPAGSYAGADNYKNYDVTKDNRFVHVQNIGVRAGTSGVGQSYTYDYNSGIFYIKEDKSKVPDTIVDADGQTWYYASTVIDTEYVRRYSASDPDGKKTVHTSQTYTGKEGEYASRAEVLGLYKTADKIGGTLMTNDIDRVDNKPADNEFLEFTVHNIYKKTKAETTELTVTKEWNGSPVPQDITEVYVKVFRKADGFAEEDFTNLIKNDKDNLPLYIDSDPVTRKYDDFDTENGWIVIKKGSDGSWETVKLKNVPKTTEDGSKTYTYYIREVGYKQGETVYNNADVFSPDYQKKNAEDTEWASVDDPGVPLVSKSADNNTSGDSTSVPNNFKVTNEIKEPEKTTYTVKKEFTGSDSNNYPTDGSVQVLVSLEEGYSADGTTAPTEWKDAGTEVMTLPRPYSENPNAVETPSSEELKDWFASEQAWTYTWKDLNVKKKVNNQEVTIWYRAKEVSVPAWFSATYPDSEGNPYGQPAEKLTDANAEALKTSQSTTVKNSPQKYSLEFDKKWSKNGEETDDWPDNVSVQVNAVRYWHLVELDESTSPATLKPGTVFYTDQPGDPFFTDTNNSLTKTLSKDKRQDKFEDLDAYAYVSIKNNDADSTKLIIAAKEAGVSLEKGRTYLVAYTYGANESKIFWSASDTTGAPMNLIVPGTQDNNDPKKYTSSIVNELTDITVKKQWRNADSNDADESWPDDATKVNYKIMRMPVYTTDSGRVIEFKDSADIETYLEKSTADAAAKGYAPLDKNNFKTGVKFDDLPAMGVKHLEPGNSYGLVSGDYLVTYRYYVVEDPDGSVTPEDSEYTYSAIEAQVFNGVATLTNEYKNITVDKKWIRNGVEEPFPAGYKVNWKVIQKDTNGNIINSDFYKAYEKPAEGSTSGTTSGSASETTSGSESDSNAPDNRLTAGTATEAAHLSHTLNYLPAAGLNANGKEVEYVYEVVEEPEGSEAPADSPYLFRPIKAEEETGEGSTKFTLVNDLTKVTVIKTGDKGSSVDVQLYATTEKPSSLETVDVKVTLDRWEEGDALKTGTVKGKITADGETVRTFELNPDDWEQTFAGLPKFKADGKTPITYSVTVDEGPSELGKATLYDTTTDSTGMIVFHLKAKGKKKAEVSYHFILEGDGTEIPENLKVWAQVQDVPDSGAWGTVFQETKILTKTTTSATIELEKTGNNQVQFGVQDNSLPDGYELVIPADMTSNPYQGGSRLTNSETGEKTITIKVRKKTGPAEGEFALTINIVKWRNNNAAGAPEYDAPSNGSVKIQIQDAYSGHVDYVNLSGPNWTETVYLANNTSENMANYKLVAVQIGSVNMLYEGDSNNITFSSNGTPVTKNLTVYTNGVQTSIQSAGGKYLKSLMKAGGSLRTNASPPDVEVEAPAESGTSTGEREINVIDKSNLPEGAVAVGKIETLNDANEWQHTWDNLPKKDEDGNDIYYYVVEKRATTSEAGVTSTTATYDIQKDETTGEFTVTITNTKTIEEPKTGTIVVEKKLEGLQKTDQKFAFYLQRASGKYFQPEGTTGTWVESTNPIWIEIYPNQKYTFTNLPLGNYVLKENTSSEATRITGYSLSTENSVTGTAGSGVSVIANGTSEFTFKNVYEPQPIRVTKQWQKSDGTPMAEAPDGATVTFHIDGSDGSTAPDIVLDGTVDEEGEVEPWIAEWKNLPRQTSGDTPVDITYTVTEVNGGWEHYKVTDENGVTYSDTDTANNIITNKEEVTNISVTKEWTGADGNPVTDKESIGFTLYQKYTDNAGETHSAVYTFAKQKVQGSGDEYSDLTNGKGTVAYVPAGSAAGQWQTIEINNLPKKTQGEDGRWYDASYYVVEDVIPDIAVIYKLGTGGSDKPEDAATQTGTITITNTNESTSLRVEKDWDDLGDNTPYELTFTLQYKTTKGGWTDKGDYKLIFNGSTYTIENTEEGSTEKYDSNVITNLDRGNSYRVIEKSYTIKPVGGSEIIKELKDEPMTGTSETTDNGRTWTSRLENRLEKVGKIGGKKTWTDGKSSHLDPRLILERTTDNTNWEKVTALKMDPTVPAAAPTGENVGEESSEYTWLTPVWSTNSTTGLREYSYENLPKYSPEGLEYTYRVTEAPTPGFSPTYSPENGQAVFTGQTVTGEDGSTETVKTATVDIENQPVGRLKVKKKWFAGASEDEMKTIEFIIEKSTDPTSTDTSNAEYWKPVKNLAGTVGQGENAKEVSSNASGLVVLEPQQENYLDGDGNPATGIAKTWEWISGNLPRYELVGGEYKPVFYRVKEAKIGDTTITDSNSAGWTITNPDPVELTVSTDQEVTIKNDRDYISLSGTKTWVTEDPEKIPDKLDLKIYRWTATWEEKTVDGRTIKEYTDQNDRTEITSLIGNMDQDTDLKQAKLDWYNTGGGSRVWTYAYTNLPKYPANTSKTIYRYSVEEVMNETLSENFTGEVVPGQVTEKGDITNWKFINTEKTSIKVIKKWIVNEKEVDGDPFDENRTVKIELIRKGGTTTTSLGVFDLKKISTSISASAVGASADGGSGSQGTGGSESGSAGGSDTPGQETGQDGQTQDGQNGQNDPAQDDNNNTSGNDWELTITDLAKYYIDTEGALQNYTYYVIEQDSGIWHVEYYMDDKNPIQADKTVAPNRMEASGEDTPIYVENSTYSYELPSSGGPGLKLFYILGGMLTAFGLALLLGRKKSRG